MDESKETAEPAVDQTEQPALDDQDGDGKRGRRRSRTMSRKEIARELRRQRAFGLVDRELEEVIREIEARRPRSRADCASGPRPCMFISCKHTPAPDHALLLSRFPRPPCLLCPFLP